MDHHTDMSDKSPLYNFLNEKPTFLRFEDEVALIKALLNLPIDWIRQNQKEFTDAVDKLADSHSVGSGFVEQTEEDDALFERFSEWLSDVQGKTGIPLTRYIDDLTPDYGKKFRRER